MVAVSDIAQVARTLRDEGLVHVADELAAAHLGIFNGTELAMKWRFLLAQALEAELSSDAREQAQSLWNELDRALA